MNSLDVLYEDNHLLALAKSAGDLVQGDRTGDTPLVDRAKDYLKQKYGKPGAVYLAVLHRLDRPVSGALLFARTSKAAGRLADAFKSRTVEKQYLALVENTPPEAAGQLDQWIAKDPDSNRSQIVGEGTPGARSARLSYEVLGPCGSRQTWLRVDLETGRHHQVRVQLSAMGCPVAGDVRYGAAAGDGSFEVFAHEHRNRAAARKKKGSHAPPRWIALHAHRLAVPHPTRGEIVDIIAPIPESWTTFGSPPDLP